MESTVYLCSLLESTVCLCPILWHHGGLVLKRQEMSHKEKGTVVEKSKTNF